MDEILQFFTKISDSFPAYIESSQIPEIDLYMDQVTTFMDTHLAGTKRNPEDKTLTKTMINNYAKDHLIPSPDKKKYSKDHILLLLLIYYSKNILSINDISKVLAPVTEALFHSDTAFSLEDFYDNLRKQSLSRMENLKKEVSEQYESAKKWSDSIDIGDTPIDKDYLAVYAFISILGMDISYKKLVIEHIIDEILPDKTPKEKEKKEKEGKDKKNSKNKA